MLKPITITYDFKIGNDFIRRQHLCETYEEYNRCVRILHENEEHYKVVDVKRVND